MTDVKKDENDVAAEKRGEDAENNAGDRGEPCGDECVGKSKGKGFAVVAYEIEASGGKGEEEV
ncbi:MAG: hypothetical protein IJW96_02490 [Clostridia bacterium]|nr:hypothetical protein [Clostridia bacterium]